MTREEEIKQAAYSQYCNSGSICFTLMCDSFKQGATWADANPKQGLVDLSQIWHSAEEEPEKGKSIISIGATGVSAYKWVDEWRCDWVDFAEWSELFRWAYIDDLLPKGGKL